MNTREIAAGVPSEPLDRNHEERKASGLSIKAYCKSAGLQANVYFYWQRKLREASMPGAIRPGKLR